MSKFTGNIIRLPAVTPTQNSASGVYTLDDQFTAQSSGTWPIVRDQYFNYTTLLLTGAVQGTAYPNPVTQPYSFLSDASTNNFVVSPNGDVSARPFNPYLNNYSNYFTGSATYLTAGVASNWQFLNSGASDYTIEAWVYLYSVSSQQFICATNAAGAAVGFNFSVSSSAALVLDFTRGVGGSFATFTSTGTLTANAWNHVAVTFATSGKTASFYINGATAGSSSNTGYSYSASNPANTLNIGREPSGTGLVTGYISNLRITNTLVYSGAFTPSAAPLTAVSGTSLLTCQSNRFRDASTNGYTITPSGSPSVSQNSPFVSYDTTNGSGYFDGTGDYASVTNSAAYRIESSSTWTWECFVYPTSLSSNVLSSNTTNASSTGHSIYLASGLLRIIQFGVNNFPSTATVKVNEWSHLAVVCNANAITFYLNGTASGTATWGSGSAGGALFIGASYLNTDLFTGYMCNMRYVVGTAIVPPAGGPTAPLQAVTNTSLLTLQTRAPATNNGFIDSSPNNFVVTRNGNTTQGSFSPFSPTGWSNYFNGSASLQTASSSSLTFGTGDFSISFWIYPTVSTAGANTGVMGIGASVNGTLLIYTKFPGFPDNTITIPVYGGGSVGSSIPLNVNQWNHVAISRASGTLSIYINGNRGANSSLADNLNGSIASIGKPYYNLSVESYTGYLADIRFVKGTALYSGTSITVPTSPSTLVAGTALLTSQYNRFYDGSGITSSFTIAGSPSVQAFSPFAPAQSYIPSQIGGSGYFDGNGDYLTIANSNDFDTNTPFTLECWVYTGSTGCMLGRGGGAASWSTTDGHQFIFYITGGVLRWQFNSGGSPVNLDSSAIPLNSWVYCAVGYNGTTTRLWLNGVSATTSTSSYTLPTTRNIIRSGLTPSGDQPFLGYISGLRFVKSDVYGVANTTITVPTAPPTAIPNTSLLLNFTNGGIVDATGKNNLETVANSGVQTSQAKWSPGSMYFDGTGDYLVSNSATTDLYAFGTGDFTVEMWVRFSTITTGVYTLIDARPSGAQGAYISIALDQSTAKIYYYVSSAIRITGTATIATNTWYHVAISRSGTNTRLFVNGTQDGSTWTTDSTNYLNPASRPIIGSSGSSVGTEALNGYIDDLRITKGVARYTSNFTPPTGPFPLG